MPSSEKDFKKSPTQEKFDHRELFKLKQLMVDQGFPELAVMRAIDQAIDKLHHSKLTKDDLNFLNLIASVTSIRKKYDSNMPCSVDDSKEFKDYKHESTDKNNPLSPTTISIRKKTISHVEEAAINALREYAASGNINTQALSATLIEEREITNKRHIEKGKIGSAMTTHQFLNQKITVGGSNFARMLNDIITTYKLEATASQSLKHKK